MNWISIKTCFEIELQKILAIGITDNVTMLMNRVPDVHFFFAVELNAHEE